MLCCKNKGMYPNGKDPSYRTEQNLESLSNFVSKLAQSQVQMLDYFQKVTDGQLTTSGHLDRIIGILERLEEVEARTLEKVDGFISVTEQRLERLEEGQQETRKNLDTLIELIRDLLRARKPE